MQNDEWGVMATTERVLNDEILAAIRDYFPRYPSRRAVVLPALHLVNERLGYVPHAAVVEIAGLLELAPAEVQDTLSFYGFFKQDRPQGRTRIWVCRSISCAACGGESLLEYLCEKLGIRPGETTPDGRVSLEYAECLGACDYAPAMLAGETLYKSLTKEKIDEFVKSLPPPGTSAGAKRAPPSTPQILNPDP
jgi:NADH-quinone oxidoreductase subunit E